MLERIRLHDFVETHFICLTDEAAKLTKKTPAFQKHYDNADYKTLLVQTGPYKKKQVRIWNFIQCRTYDVRKKLLFKYPDESGGMGVSAIEQCLEQINFGLGDARPNAHWLVLDERAGTPAQIAAWLRKNCQDDVIVLEGNRRVRASFVSDDDYLLARINFS